MVDDAVAAAAAAATPTASLVCWKNLPNLLVAVVTVADGLVVLLVALVSVFVVIVDRGDVDGGINSVDEGTSALGAASASRRLESSASIDSIGSGSTKGPSGLSFAWAVDGRAFSILLPLVGVATGPIFSTTSCKTLGVDNASARPNNLRNP